MYFVCVYYIYKDTSIHMIWHATPFPVPVVSWRHSGNGTLLMRSAQPLVGVTRSRCTQDEKLIMSVAGVVPPPR